MAALSTIALLAAAAGKTALDFSEQRKSAKLVEQQGDAQAGFLRTNASLADNQAADATARGEEGASSVTRATRALGGSQRAALAAQGVNIGSGSALDVVESDQRLGALDALTIRNNAAREAWGFQTQAAGYRSQADWTQSAARNQAKGIRRQSVGTLLGGAAELANVWASAPKGVGTTVPTKSAGVDPSGFTQRQTYKKPVGWNG